MSSATQGTAGFASHYVRQRHPHRPYSYYPFSSYSNLPPLHHWPFWRQQCTSRQECSSSAKLRKKTINLWYFNGNKNKTNVVVLYKNRSLQNTCDEYKASGVVVIFAIRFGVLNRPKCRSRNRFPGLFPPSIPQESLPLLLGNNFCYQAVLGKCAAVAWQHHIIESHIRKGREPAVLWAATLVILFSLGYRVWCPIRTIFPLLPKNDCPLRKKILQ